MIDELIRSRIASKLSQEEARGRFSGAAGIVWAARTHTPKVLTLAFGQADDAARIENTAETRFPIGSLSKLFTATTVLLLWQRGALPLDAPVASYLGSGGPTWAEQVTLHHLLSHTSGLPSIFRNQPELDRFFESLGERRGHSGSETPDVRRSHPAWGSALEAAPVSREALWRAIQTLPLRAAPGHRYEYSNTGYVLTALIVERLLHTPFSQLVNEHVLAPLGLHDTALVNGDRHVDEFSVVATQRSSSRTHAVGHFGAAAAPRIHPSWLLGSGDLESTVGDLLTFSRGLDNDTLLGEAARERLLFRPLAARDSTGPKEDPLILGYGWRVWTPRDRRRSATEPAPVPIAWHDGLLPGVLCTLHRPLHGESAVVLLCNRLPSSGHTRVATLSLRRLARELLHTISAPPAARTSEAGESVDEESATALSGRPLLDALCGTYALETAQRLVITAQADGRFQIRGEGMPPFSLIGMTQNVDAVATALRERACALLSALEQGAISHQQASASPQANRRTEESRAQLRALSAQQLPDPEALCSLWQSLTGREGFGSLEAFHVLQHEGSQLVVCRCHFATRPLDLHVHFDDEGKIVGFYLHPIGTAPAVCELPLVPEGPGSCLGDGYLAATQDLRLTLLRKNIGPPDEADVLLLRGEEENSVPRRAIRICY